MSESKVHPLCEYCSKIEFDYKVLRDDQHLIWKLGPWSSLKQSQCPFCKLVRRAIYEWHRIDPHDDMEVHTWSSVEVMWTRNDHEVDKRGCFRLTRYSEGWGPEICFAARAEHTTATASPRYMRRTVKPEFDIDMLASWLTICSTKHWTSCNISASGSRTFDQLYPGLPAIRFIDVQRNCLEERRDLCQYVALSYVWGTAVKFRLTRAILPALLQDGQLLRIYKNLPRTVRDAIILVRRLELRYLWVDALCLVQDDKEDVAAGIAVMDQVYEQSWFTIVAACGHDADAGLPGIREESRKEFEPCIEVKPGVFLGLQTKLDSLLRSSVHGQRAWTFQETLLSRRSLFFIDDRILFRCRQSQFSEACLDDPTTRFNDGWLSTVATPFTMDKDSPLDTLNEILGAYTMRALTDQDDAIHATAGILRRFSEMLRCSFFQGMPTAAFDSAILFDQWPLTPLRRRVNFPSYSWAGWIGGLGTVLSTGGDGSDIANIGRCNNWLRDGTWIIWYKRSPSGVLSLVWDPAANESFPVNDPSIVRYRERQPFRPPLGLPNITTTRTAPTEQFEHDIVPRSYPLLQFWTLTILVNLNLNDPFTPSASIRDSRGSVCGYVGLDSFGEMPFYNSQGPFELLLLSDYDEDEYNVMLIEWNGHVAERRGKGKFRKTAVAYGLPPGAVWKEILLG